MDNLISSSDLQTDVQTFENVYDEYEYYVDKYQLEYGERTVVTYQCGGFYEIYSIEDGKVNTKEISDILGIEVSKRNKAIPEISRQNCKMMGWPIHAMNKFIPLLVDHNYTIVIVDQINPENHTIRKNTKTVLKGKNRIERAVTQIVSKGSFIDESWYDNEGQGKYVMCIYFEHIKNAKVKFVDKNIYAFGVSIIDGSTGSNSFYEIVPRENDSSYCFDELIRLRYLFPPCEVIIISEFDRFIPPNSNILTKNDFIIHLSLPSSCHIIDKISRLQPDQTKSFYQNHILKKAFPQTGLLSPIEYLDLEKLYYARISYSFMIEYLSKHNENIVQKLTRPLTSLANLTDTCSMNQNKLVVLSSNAIEQLEIQNALLPILNKCVTLMGRRYFRYRLLNPQHDTDFLKDSYSMIHYYMQRGLKYINSVRQELKSVYDLERLFRKILMRSCTLNDILNINTSLKSVISIVNEEKEMYNQVDTDLVRTVHDELKSKFYKENGEVDSEPESDIKPVFNKELYGEHFSLFDAVAKKRGLLDNLVDEINKQTDIACKHFKIEKNDRDGYFLTCTNKRYNECKNKLCDFKFKAFSWNNICVKSQTNIVKITHSWLDGLNREINQLLDEITQQNNALLTQILTDMTLKYQNDFPKICLMVNKLDFLTTCSMNAIQKCLCEPVIDESGSQNVSFLEAKNLRHPIVEEIDTQVPFIGNDVCLGKNNCKGMLLYGLNASGKSTLMKSVALNVIMAQAGMYTCSEKFSFYPYRYIFSRITRGDDIKKGQSTFMIEMQELRNIIKRSDAFSLVIGDELCSGTESKSALGIVSAGLWTLSRKNRCSHIFTTHLHELTNIDEVKELENEGLLNICHLHVEFDTVTQKLIYDRKLRNGQGLSIYGIEVCKALDMNDDFLMLADDIRRKCCVSDHPNERRSRYNKKLIVDICQICKNKADEVHHIKFQKDADDTGFINGTHKNRLSNLINVCSKCHDMIHDGSLEISGYKQTSDCVEIQYEKKEKNIDDKELMKDIKALRFEKKMTLKKIAEDLDLSVYRVKKYLDNF